MKRLRCGTPGRQGIFRFMIKLTGNETVTARAGLPLVLEVGRALRLDEEVARRVQLGSRERGYSVNDKLEALVLLIAAGGDRVEDIQVLAEDRGLMRLLDRTLPSPDSLLRFLHEVGGGRDHAAAQEQARAHSASRGELCHVPAESDAMRGLEAVNHALIARATATTSPCVATVDHDATIIESHKRTARIAYEGTRGYQPMLAVWAEQGLVLVDEFRDGNVPAGKDPLHSIERAFGALPATVTQRYFRGDSANYHVDVLKYLVKQDIGFTISADMTPQLRTVCCAVDEAAWSLLETRTTQDVHIADVEFAPGVWSKDAAPLRYVALRMTPHQSELALDSSDAPRGPKFLAVVSNRRSVPAAELVSWHWQKAGTIEHIHRILKDELGAGVMPSPTFATNAAWLRINVLTANLLTALKRIALPSALHAARPKRLRFELFTIPARVSLHQRQLLVDLSASTDRIATFTHARSSLLALLLQT